MDHEKNHEELDELLNGIRDLIDEDAETAQEGPDADAPIDISEDDVQELSDFTLPEYLEQELAAELSQQEPVADEVQEEDMPEAPEETEADFQQQRWTDRQRVPRHVAKLQNNQEEAYAKWLQEQEEKGEQLPPVFEEEKPRRKKRGKHPFEELPEEEAEYEPQTDDGKRKKHPALWFCLVMLVILAAVVITAVWVLPQQPAVSSDRERVSGVSTILVAGVDDTLAHTDMLMLLTVDEPGERISVISIPRDTVVGDTAIGNVYGLSNGGSEGIAALKEAVGGCIGFEPDGCIVFSPAAVKQFIDAMGGVDFNVPATIRCGEVELKAGAGTLNGEQAYALLRLRDETQLLDLERTQLQQQFLSALMYQCADFGTILDAPELLDILAEKTVTDLSTENFMWLARAAYGVDFGNVYMQTLPGDAEQIEGSYVLDPQAVLQTVNAYCSPYVYGIEEEDLLMEPVQTAYTEP